MLLDLSSMYWIIGMFTLKLVLFLSTIHASEKVVTLTICSISLIAAGDGEVLFTIDCS